MNLARFACLTALWASLILATSTRSSTAQSLLVSSNGAARVDRFNSTTGAYTDVFASGNGMSGIHGVAFGPDHRVYVASGDSNAVVKRFNGRTGAFVDNFVGSAGGLSNPIGLAFGPDGDLWVTCAGNNSIRRFDPAGVLKQTVTAGSPSTPIGIVLGPDNLLYVCSGDGDAIKRYNTTTGAFIDNFVTGVNNPHEAAFGPDGHIYVTSWQDQKVYKFNGTTGDSMGTFVSSIAGPYGVTFGPDNNLYVCSVSEGKVKRYSGSTGAFIDNFASMGGATQLTFVPAYNVAPDAVNDTTSTPFQTASDFNVVANDTDFDGDSLTVEIDTPPAHGTATVNADNTVHYVPDTGYKGADSFTYNVDDGHGGTDTATVNVTITNPTPLITSLDPNPAEKGTAFTLRILGQYFTNSTVVNWNGVGRATTFVNEGELTVAVSITDTALSGAALISATDSAPGGGGTSNSVSLNIAAPIVKLSILDVFINGNTVSAVFEVKNLGTLAVANVKLTDATIANYITGFTFDGLPIPLTLAPSLAPGASARGTVTFTDSTLFAGLMAFLKGEGSYNTQYRTYKITAAKLTLLIGAVKSVTLQPSTVLGGTSVTGTVKLNINAPGGGLTVNLSSTNSAASAPASVTVPGGSTSATFTVTTVPAATTTKGNIIASAAGIAVAARLTVKPSTIVGISFNPTSVRSGQTTTGTITLNNAAPAGYSVTLTSSDPAALSVPSSVAFVEGATTATFTATAGTVAAYTIVTVVGQDPSGTTKDRVIAVKR